MSTANTTVKSLSAYNVIRELILRGELLPGARLVLADLESKIGIGRVPIREALMRLDRTGLIQNIPYKGAVVAPVPSLREVQHIYEMRVQVECILAREAMENAGDAEYAELEQLLEKAVEPSEERSFFFQSDREFHAAIYRMANMPHLNSTATNLVDHVEIFLNSRFYALQDQEIIQHQHRDILEALKKKDVDALTDSLKKNILIGLELIKSEMSRLGQKYW